MKFSARCRQYSARMALALPLAAGAETQSLLSEDDIFGDIPAVTLAARMEQTVNQTPVSVTIIDRELIEASGAQTWADIFRLVPGFQSYYINNHRFGVSYHGIGREFTNHLEVMVDGRSVYEPLFSAVNWGTLGLNLANIEYIEIVRGSSVPAQGANAFAGALNIVTHRPVDDGSLSVHATTGDQSTRNLALIKDGSIAGMNYQATLDYRHNSGFPAVAEGPMDDDEELIQGNFRGIYTPNLNDTLDLQLGYAHNRVGWGDADHPDEYAPATMESSFQSLKWTRSRSSSSEIRIHGYHNLFTGRNFVNLGPVWSLIGLDADTAAFIRELDPVPDELVQAFADDFGTDTSVIADLLPLLDNDVIEGFRDIRSERYDLELQQQWRLNGVFRATWGLGSRYERVRGDALFDSDEWIDETAFRLFGQTEWQPLSSLMLNAGLMVEDTYVGTLASPRVSANVFLSPDHTLRAAYAQGKRAPSLLEGNERNIGRFDDFIYQAIREAGDDLGEETLDRYELSYLGFWPASGLSFDISLFREKITDGLDDYRVPTELPTSLFDSAQAVIANSAEWEIDGVEFQLTYRPLPDTLIRAHYANLDLDSRRLDRIEPEPVFQDFDNRMARHSGGLLISQKFSGNWSGSLFTYSQSGVRWADGNQVDGFTRVDAQLAYRFRLASDTGRIRLVAQNLGDSYSEFNTNNRFRTRVFLQLEIKFQ